MITFRGKKYPRYWGDDISLSEALTRLGVKKYTVQKMEYEHASQAQIVLHLNYSDAPEGADFIFVWAKIVGRTPYEDIPFYTIDKQQVDRILLNRGLPICDAIDLLEEKRAAAMATLELATKAMMTLEPISDAATFALESSAGDNDSVSPDLQRHWREQEHAYLVAMARVRAAKKEVDSCRII